MKLPALLGLLLLSVCPTCASLPTQPRELPPIPRYAPTELGPIPIRRVQNLYCEVEGVKVKAIGCFHAHPYSIEIEEPLSREDEYFVLYHELFHVATYASGNWFKNGEIADSIADFVARERMVELRAGWPR